MSDELVLKDSKIPMEKEYERRTRNMAFERYPDLFHIPEGVMYMISHQNYSGSLDWEENEYGYVQSYQQGANRHEDVILCLFCL